MLFPRPVKQDLLAKRLDQSRGFMRADLSIASAATKAGRQPAFKPVARLAEVADKKSLLAVAAFVAGVGLARGDRKMKRAGLRMALAVGLATTAARVGKRMISRSRPTKLVDENRHAIFLGGPDEKIWNSFPSAHAAGGFAAARAIGREYPVFALPAVTTSLVAGALKVLKGDHFPSDILAGLLLGSAAEAMAHALLPVREEKQ
jgi:undecaprenyl-diphosphatase